MNPHKSFAITRSRELRQSQTPYEAALWQLLRDHRMAGYHWRRQHPIGPYIADFACVKSKLVVELDGDSHDDREESDAHRDAMLQQLGWRTLRIANRDLMHSPEGVWQTVLQSLVDAGP
ncbi:MAG TPA: DUF559 domain-containing protein [Abditibacteriaceae bacterium]|jgi:very-short-patch-repair endonuclease